MVNDNQIIPENRILTHEATTIFINEGKDLTNSPKLYDLDLEFSNTKKNKASVIWISLILFTLLFIAAAFGVTKYIEVKNSQIPISIYAFDDINLREIFDKAKQHEKDMQLALRDLEDLHKRKEKRLDGINQIAIDNISILEANNSAENIVKINKIRKQLPIDVEKETEVWDNKISKVKKRIKAIQKEIDSYDTRILEKAKEQEAIINNQQERFDIELSNSIKYYEDKIKMIQNDYNAKIKTINYTNKQIIYSIKEKNSEKISELEDRYNPDFTDDYLFIKEPQMSKPIFKMDSSTNIPTVLLSEKMITKEGIYSSARDYYRGIKTFNRLEEIPFYNSTLNSIKYLKGLYTDSANQYAELLGNVTTNLEWKNYRINRQGGELEQFNYFMTSFVKNNRINGVIVDPRDVAIKVFIDPIYSVKEGSIGYIYRNDSDFIGTIKFSYVGNILKAFVNKLSDDDRKIEPFDMILIVIE